LLSLYQFWDFSQYKRRKTYLGTMLPAGGRSWQLISPYFVGATVVKLSGN
jgi:hypothetical protein